MSVQAWLASVPAAPSLVLPTSGRAPRRAFGHCVIGVARSELPGGKGAGYCADSFTMSSLQSGFEDAGLRHAQGGGPPGGFPPPGGHPPPGAPPGHPPPGGYPPGPPPGGYPPPGGFAPGYHPGAPGLAPYGGYPGAPGFAPSEAEIGELRRRAEKWFVLSIVSIFCGCGLLGVVNIVLASNAKTSIERGDIADAQSKLQVVKILCSIGFVVAGLVLVLYLLYFVLVGAAIFASAAGS